MVEKWFQSLREIWLNKDIEHIGNILSSHFQYYEDPFAPPLTTVDEVRAAWTEALDQDILTLEICPLLSQGTEGCATYELSYRDLSGIVHDSRGAYYIQLDNEGRAVEFRQWWVNKS